MTASPNAADLAGRNVLIVEDEYFLAVEMAEAVRRAGGTALGPVPNVEGAMAIVAKAVVDAAVLDIHLDEETSFPVAEALRVKGVPVMFVTGYDHWFLPSELADLPVHRKPANPDSILRLLFGPTSDRHAAKPVDGDRPT